MHEPIRHIARSRTATVAIGAFEKTVEVWDVSLCRRIASLSTVLDFGGQRLCLDGTGHRCYAGAYKRHGVVSYDLPAEGVPWSRADIKRVQSICCSSDDRRLFVGVEDGPALIIDAQDGKTLERLRGVRQVYENITGTARLLDRANPVVEVSAGRSFAVTRTTFAMLDVAFGPGAFCVSESGGPTRCLDLDGGREIWRYEPRQGEHLLSVAYCPSAEGFVGVSCEYAETSRQTLVHLRSGHVRELAELGTPAVADFCLSGEALVLADGRLLSSSTGKVLRLVPFVDGAG